MRNAKLGQLGQFRFAVDEVWVVFSECAQPHGTAQLRVHSQQEIALRIDESQHEVTIEYQIQRVLVNEHLVEGWT